MSYIPQQSIIAVVQGSVIAIPTGNQSVSGAVSVSNLPGNQSVSGTLNIGNLAGNQSVSGALNVSNFPGNQSVSGAVAVSNFPGNQSVSGTVNIGTQSGSVVAQVSNFPTNQNVSGSVISFPGGNQSVSGTVTVAFPTNQNVGGSVISFQGTDPWRIAANASSIIVVVQGSVATTAQAAANQSVSGTVGASIIGLTPVYIVGSVITTGAPAANQSVSGTVGASVVGHAPVFIIGGSVATATTNSSVMLLNSSAIIGSVTTLQGTTPWVVSPHSVSGTVGTSILGVAHLTRETTASATDVGIAVYPLKVSRPAYQYVSSMITLPVAASSLFQAVTLWHPSASAKDVFIIELGVNYRSVQTAGTSAWNLQFTSTDGAGGQVHTAQGLDRGDAQSSIIARFTPTSAPSVVGFPIQNALFPLPAAASPMVTFDSYNLFRAKDLDSYSDAIKLRASTPEGLMIGHSILAALTTAPVVNIYARWIERT